MTALYVILGILAAIILLLCLPVHVKASYVGSFLFDVRYAFLRFTLYPPKPKKEKPEKPEKEEEPKEEKKEKPPKENMFQTFYNNQGFDGVMGLIHSAGQSVGGFLHSMYRHLIIHDLYLRMYIAGGDAARCAVKYGRVQGAVMPPLALICHTCRVRKYDIDISPDFIATFSSAEFYFHCSIRPLFVLGAVIALLFRLFFKVLLKLMRSKPAQAKEASVHKVNNENPEIKQGGALL